MIDDGVGGIEFEFVDFSEHKQSALNDVSRGIVTF